VQPEEKVVARQRLGNHISAETNALATVEELMDACFRCGPCRIKYSICSKAKIGNCLPKLVYLSLECTFTLCEVTFT
jgi:hypothetical protein